MSAAIKLSPGAVRAAERINYLAGLNEDFLSDDKLAGIIDSETHAGEWSSEVRKMLDWHDTTARRENFSRCGYEWCNSMRPLLAKLES